jgi:stage IV sporulation protein A
VENQSIYQDIAERTEGDIYIGVVGPVRTGKSTFIKRFMETLVIPNIDNVYRRERARDELPQSGSGHTIMTAEPKFVPENAVEVSVGPANFKIRMIDCVGYLVPGAIGQLENEMPRMVMTPWFDHEIPMAQAAEIGTQKVISEHATIGLVITTDGSITDIPRSDYVDAEKRVISELKAIGKPFMVLVNSVAPLSPNAQEIKEKIASDYGVTCMAVDCMNLNEDMINEIIRNVLFEFPIKEIDIVLPHWVESLQDQHWLKSEIYSGLLSTFSNISRMWEAEKAVETLAGQSYISLGKLDNLNLGEGIVNATLGVPREMFYKILSEQVGYGITDDGDLLPLLETLTVAKKEYDKVRSAIEQVKATGYGIVFPSVDELTLEEPEMMRQGGRFGVRLRASAPSIHMLRADIKTEISPIVGSEKQSEELVEYLMSEFDGNTAKIWDSNIFGRSLQQLVNEGLQNKLARMPEDAREKLQETLERIINEGSGGLICIIL